MTSNAGDGVPSPSPHRRPVGRVIAVAIGLIEGVLIAGYALSIGVFELVGTTSGVAGNTDVAPLALVVILLVFGVLIIAVAMAVWSGKDAARTPFMVIQAFVVIAAWTLAEADVGWERTLGIAIIVAAVVAAASLLAGSRPNGSDG